MYAENHLIKVKEVYLSFCSKINAANKEQPLYLMSVMKMVKICGDILSEVVAFLG